MVALDQPVSQFRLLEKLGGGGTGVVDRAQGERLDRGVTMNLITSYKLLGGEV